MWDRMDKDSKEWNFFLESIWEFQGLKKVVELKDEIKNVFYDECQGITAVAVNLFILAQERALQEGKEEITVGIIRETAKNDLHMIQPMIKALRNNNLSEIMRYEDISINLEEITEKYKSNIELSGIIEESFKERKKTVELRRRSIVENLVLELTSMDMFNNLTNSDIQKLCEKIVEKASLDEEYSTLKINAFKKAMELEEKNKESKKEKIDIKEEGLLAIYEDAKKKREHTYEALKRKGFIKNPFDEFLNVN